MHFIIAPPPQASVGIRDSAARFAVRRIFCVGQNYAAHAEEMGSNPARDAPFFFTKPADAVVDSGAVIPYPLDTADLQHEIELVVALGVGGVAIPQSTALTHVWGYGVGIDLTRRDLQRAAKSAGRPWDLSKGFDQSAPCAPLVPVAAPFALPSGPPGENSSSIWLAVNGARKQDASVAQMIWSVAEIIAILSTSIALAPGDLIYTGTPAGVGTVVAGDHLHGGIDGLGEIAVDIV